LTDTPRPVVRLTGDISGGPGYTGLRAAVYVGAVVAGVAALAASFIPRRALHVPEPVPALATA
jgi:hypothetical protein